MRKGEGGGALKLHRSMGWGRAVLLLGFAVGLLVVGFGRLALHQSWVRFGGMEVHQLWEFDGFPAEAGMALAGAFLVGAVWSCAGFLRGLGILLLFAILLAVAAIIAESRERRDAIAAWCDARVVELTWRGEAGESVYERVRDGAAVVVQPSGQPVSLVNNPSARNPSWRELCDFLRVDRTDEQKYVPGIFVCSCFAEMLHNNAEAAGLRCAYVTVDLPEGHALNAFRTTDRGLVFIDCTASLRGDAPSHDSIVDLSEGRDYTPRAIFAGDGWTYLSMGRASHINVTW